jgi:uncharacterized protein YbjT (DUF2867 family)
MTKALDEIAPNDIAPGNNTMTRDLSVGMIGATGAVGGHVARVLTGMPQVTRLLLIGRRAVEGLDGPRLVQHVCDPTLASTYATRLVGVTAAICTLGVGEPSKVSHDELVRIDKTAALDFAAACKTAGVQHFSLLASVAASARSTNFYLRTKGELEDGLRALKFERLSLFHPSVILTPTNRYGMSQAIVLAITPRLTPLLIGSARKYRGIEVERLGCAIARNLLADKSGEETLHGDEIRQLSDQ